MGSSPSKIYSFDEIYTDNIHDLEVEIKGDDAILRYYYTSPYIHNMYVYEKPTVYRREDIIKITNREALKMDLYTRTVLSKYDCVKLAEFINDNHHIQQ